eukprot:TRINITY_DN75518_c0_g1_i1.p1 TRINITY_DN75518_c0_g1~~TRINITY_DN75518_c0_g1_i1.p1  ORF type:complete len:124 (+),score=30.37 TRINITY_DN75518_c0_g1_i1:69-440(+)
MQSTAALRVGVRSAAAAQRRTCITHMYHDNMTQHIPRLREKGPPRMGRDMLRADDQKYDPDWKYRMGGSAVRSQQALENVEFQERILTYKLERADYEVREVPFGLAPPPPAREISPRITLDML